MTVALVVLVLLLTAWATLFLLGSAAPTVRRELAGLPFPQGCAVLVLGFLFVWVPFSFAALVTVAAFLAVIHG